YLCSALPGRPRALLSSPTRRSSDLSPKWGQVSPAEFIPLAETNGLIVGIGEWVLQQAARQLQQWRNDGLPVFRLAINLSALQFIDRKITRLNSSHVKISYAGFRLEE